MVDPEFTVELDLSDYPTSHWPKYKSLIEDLRRRLRVRFSHNRPVLTLETRTPSRWFEVILRTAEDYAVRFLMRGDNLYLVGYRMENGQEWFEFTETDDEGNIQRLIPGSTLLGFSGNYNALLNAANRSWEDVRLSWNDLRMAVDNLNTDEGWQRARSLLNVILMINEAIRFEDLSDYFSANYDQSLPFSSSFQNLVRSWGNLSGRLLRADIDPDLYYFRLPDPNDLEIQTAEQAAAALGILKDCVSRFQSLRRVPRMAMNDGDELYGVPLVEVFSVRINTGYGDRVGLCGMVTVTDGLSCQYIYNKTRDDPESIHTGDTILLTGPARPISAYDTFTIDVDLIDKNKDPPNDEISYGQISWNVFVTTNEYDKPLLKDVEGKNGSVTVNYVVLRNAVEAAVEITLINGDKKDPAEVYGLITARSDKFTNESMLFWKTSEDKDIEVRPGNDIPLLKSAVAVPLNSSQLIVRAELFNRDREAISSYEIANGTAVFPTSLSGTSTKSIFAKYGEIQVKVTWTDN
ncbi:60 kDa jasmonate-induced protein-like [Malania oleifera]|uniref:60 kDa jasmonate-induced protein-like n=1 Tax=Malania oleifera TaxID=397392 RepID=UPI0025AE8816|nr:60 kDa jasmonate-induced protein-like [Malania oleifera]